MSRGLAVNVWKSLEINENICDMMQHRFVGPSSSKFLILLVRTAGLEPAQGFPQGILSPLRLPFRHVRENGQLHEVRGCGQLYDVREGGQLYKVRERDHPRSRQ